MVGVPDCDQRASTDGLPGGNPQYEISASGEPSRDLILLLVTALADPDDPAQMDPATGLSPRMGEDDASIVRTLDGVAEALLAVVKARREELPEGTADGDLAAARLAHEKSRRGPSGTRDSAGGGCTGAGCRRR